MSHSANTSPGRDSGQGDPPMAGEPRWEDLARDLKQLRHSGEPLRAEWYAIEECEEFGIWLLLPDGPDSAEVRAEFSLIAARAIAKLGQSPIDIPQALQHDPHWELYCKLEEEIAQRAGKTVHMRDAVPFGLGKVDRDAVDPCTRAWLELLRHESPAFHISATGWSAIKDKKYNFSHGTILDVCKASAVYCTLRARDDIRARLVSSRPNTATPGDESISKLVGEGWVPAHRADWREDAAVALKAPAFLRPAKAARLEAIGSLRSKAAESVQHAKPQTRDELERCLWPSFLEYAERVFDTMAEFRLASHRSRSVAYGRWLRSKCLPIVVDDICKPIFGQFPITWDPLESTCRHASLSIL